MHPTRRMYPQYQEVKTMSEFELEMAEKAGLARTKLCPIDTYNLRHCRIDCGWYHQESENCAMVVIANQLFQGIIQIQKMEHESV